MAKKVIYLESPCCNIKFAKHIIHRGKWNPEKEIICSNCESPSELSEWGWYAKEKIVIFREMDFEESSYYIRGEIS